MVTELSLPQRSSLLDIVPEAYRRDMAAWPGFDPKSLPTEKQARFKKLSHGLTLLLAG